MKDSEGPPPRQADTPVPDSEGPPPRQADTPVPDSEGPPPRQADTPVPFDDGVGTGWATGITEVHARWSAPLPPPEAMREYESLLPGATRRLFDQYEKQSDHRIQMESDMAPAVRRTLLRGQWMSYSLAMTAMVLSGVLAVWGRGIVSILVASLVIIPIASLAAVLIAGRRGARGKARKLQP